LGRCSVAINHFSHVTRDVLGYDHAEFSGFVPAPGKTCRGFATRNSYRSPVHGFFGM
jgi:hypothetical protein